MAALPQRASGLLVPAAVGAFVVLGMAAAVLAPGRAADVYVVIAAAALLAGGVYLAWNADPAWTLTAGIVLTVFSGQWDRMGLPTVLAPDRILLLTGLAGVILRGPGSQFRPRLDIRPIHWFLFAGVLYVAASAAAVGTLFDRDALFVLLERYGIIPFLLFLTAPIVFSTPARRTVLLTGLVISGAYLGLIALLEGIGADSLVFPQYIVDENIGIHIDRARGPFLEAGTNGLALFACGAAAVMAAATYSRPAHRRAAAVVALLCLVGVVFTLTRQVWVGATLGTIAGMLLAPGARRYVLPTLLLGVAVAAVLFATVPGLATSAEERRTQQGPIYDRYNQIAAAFNAIEERPLFGVGWQNFVGNNDEYVELNPDVPLTGTRAPVHNVTLTYASELGLIGATAWVSAFLIAIGGALLAPVTRAGVPWRALLGAVLGCFLVVSNFEFATAYSNMLIWALAGVVLSTVAPRRAEA